MILFLLSWKLALATLTVFPSADRRDGDLPQEVEPLLPRSSARHSARSRRRSPRTSPACASSRRSRASAPPARTSGGSARTTASRTSETVVQNALYFPFVDLLSSIATAIVLGYGGYLVFDGQTTIGVLTAFLGYATNFFDPVQQLSQLYSTFLSAVAALDKIMEVLVAGARRSTDAADAAELARGPRPRPLRRRPLLLRHRPGGAARHRPRRAAGHDGGARRPHRRRQVDDREADRPLLRPDRRARSRSTAIDLRDVTAGVAPPAARDRAAGGLPLRRHRRREHRVRPARSRPRGDRRGRARRRRRRVHRAARRRATTPSSASAASASRSASASSSRSRARCSPTRAS